MSIERNDWEQEPKFGCSKTSLGNNAFCSIAKVDMWITPDKHLSE